MVRDTGLVESVEPGLPAGPDGAGTGGGTGGGTGIMVVVLFGFVVCDAEVGFKIVVGFVDEALLCFPPGFRWGIRSAYLWLAPSSKLRP